MVQCGTDKILKYYLDELRLQRVKETNIERRDRVVSIPASYSESLDLEAGDPVWNFLRFPLIPIGKSCNSTLKYFTVTTFQIISRKQAIYYSAVHNQAVEIASLSNRGINKSYRKDC
jgi:hypothetical protein